LNSDQKKRVLIAPLNWGLGHAARVIPIIRLLLKQKFDVFIAAYGGSGELLKREFPDLKYIEFPSYSIEYSPRNKQTIKLFFQIPAILFWTVKEHFRLKKIVRKHYISIVISDHRYGLWNKKTYNIFLIHQLNMRFPKRVRIFENLFNKLQHYVIRRYNECWVPDFEFPDNLAGELTRQPKGIMNLKYTGPLSRFKDLSIYNRNERTYEILVVLSGPEPQRTILEDKLVKELREIKKTVLIVRGVEGQDEIYAKESIHYADMLTSDKLGKYLTSAECVICRSGYTSIMDLFLLQKKAIIIPTPGQPEQEYLAWWLDSKGYFVKTDQDKLLLENAFKKLQSVKFSNLNYNDTLFGLVNKIGSKTANK
jgi:uncharacterized protein (TIGR00661 family)